MKIAPRLNRAALLGTAVAALITLNALWNPTSVRAIKEVDRKAGFGLVSLVAGQQARLSVVHTMAIDPEDATSGDSAARRVTLAFDIYAVETATEDDSTAIEGGRATFLSHRFVRREARQVTLRPGQAASFDYLAVENTWLSAVVVEDPNIRGIDDPDIKSRLVDDPNLRGTLEVREGGRSMFVLSPAAVLIGEVDGKGR